MIWQNVRAQPRAFLMDDSSYLFCFPSIWCKEFMAAIRRKYPKDLPKLPSSAFTANSGALDAFPLTSPNALQPAQVVDANVVSNDINYSQWKKEAGQNLGSKIRGVVLALPASEIPAALKECV